MLSDEQIAKIEQRVNYAMYIRALPVAFDVVRDAKSLLADRKELFSELERLKAECVDYVKWHKEVCDELKAAVEALEKEFLENENIESKRLLAENAALKRAIYKWKPCKMCENYSTYDFCDDCGGEHFKFAFDRFKEGGGGE